MEIISTLLPYVSTILTACLFPAIRKIYNMMTANQAATFAMLQKQILDMCKECQAKECVTAEDGETLSNLFHQYEAMGGNGFVKKQVEITFELPQC